MFAVPDYAVPTPSAAPTAVLRHPVLIACHYAAERDSWRHLLRYDPDQRFAALITSDDVQEVWLMSWLPGQHTTPHDHGRATGAFTIVDGQLSETVARPALRDRARTDTHTVSRGQSRVFGPGYVHDVRNHGPDPVVSVHVYRGPGRTVRPHPLDSVRDPREWVSGACPTGSVDPDTSVR